MELMEGLVIYFVLWWIVLFAVLPWGVRVEASPEVGHAASAPTNPRLGLKFLITSGVTAVLWVLVYWMICAKVIHFE